MQKSNYKLIGVAMKRILPLLFLIFLATDSYSQKPWDPFNPNYTYHLSPSQFNIINPFKVDSIGLNGLDTIYYFNRVLGKCDTCHAYTGVYSNDRPKMFQRKCIIRDSLWIFCDPDTFYYKPYAQLGDTWIIDSNTMKQAEVVQIYSGTYLGLADSLKKIQIGQNDYTVLSENYGFLKYYHVLNDNDYKLVGIPELNVGIRSLNYSDVFSFEVGDIFFYKQRRFKSYSYSYLIWTRREIIHKSNNGDSLVYQVKETCREVDLYAIPFDTIEYQTMDTIVYIDSTNHPLNRHDREFVSSICPRGYYQGMHKSTNHAYVGRDDYYSVYDHYLDDIFVLNYDIFAWAEWVKGKGATSIGYSSLDSADRIELIGSIIDGDTSGWHCSEGFLLSTPTKVDNKTQIKIYPNPSKGLITLQSNQEGTCNFILYNTFGQEVYTERIQFLDERILDLRFMPSGTYYFRVVEENGWCQQGKLIIL